MKIILLTLISSKNIWRLKMEKELCTTQDKRGLTLLNSEQRKERAKKAVAARWDKTLPLATHGAISCS